MYHTVYVVLYIIYMNVYILYCLFIVVKMGLNVKLKKQKVN